jgi:hypothetical protein
MKADIDTEITREQWMLAHAFIGVVIACNAPFCAGPDDEEEEINRDPDYIENVASEIAAHCSVMQLEDAIDVLKEAIEIRESEQ